VKAAKWAWPAFDDAHLLNLNKKRCVRRCQRGEYWFAPHAEIDPSGTRASRLTRNSQSS
jgi:hypothetical protein